MDTQAIINAINQIQLHNDDQVIAYDKKGFIDLVKERLEDEYYNDLEQLKEYEPEIFELYEKVKSLDETIVINLFDGSCANEGMLLLKDLTKEHLQFFTSPNNQAERLELLRLKENYKNL